MISYDNNNNDFESESNISKIVDKQELIDKNQIAENNQQIFIKKPKHQKISSLILHKTNYLARQNYLSARSSQSNNNSEFEQPIQEIENNKAEIQTPENCLICFSEKPNAVIMECGHGGICTSCSLDLWKKNNECYLCRNQITSFLEIDLENSQGEFLKVISETVLDGAKQQ